MHPSERLRVHGPVRSAFEDPRAARACGIGTLAAALGLAALAGAAIALVVQSTIQ